MLGASAQACQPACAPTDEPDTLMDICNAIADLFESYVTYVRFTGPRVVWHSVNDRTMYGRGPEDFDLLSVTLRKGITVTLDCGSNGRHKPAFRFTDRANSELTLTQDQDPAALKWLADHNVSPEKLKQLADRILVLPMWSTGWFFIQPCTRSLVGQCPECPCTCETEQIA